MLSRDLGGPGTEDAMLIVYNMMIDCFMLES